MLDLNYRKRHVIARILAVAVISAAMLGMATTSARAAGCYGADCTGYDPVAMGCSADATTVEEVDIQPGSSLPGGESAVIQLRYSAKCGAAWARVLANFTTGILVENNQSDYAEYKTVPNVFSWTDMVNDAGSSVHADACLGNHDINNHCTYQW
jgi:hypothetical protein